MKTLFIFFSLVIVFAACKQKAAENKSKENYSITNSACNKGLQAAKADEKKGIIGYYFWGIAIPPIAKVLHEKYKIKVYAKGCSIDNSEVQNWNCYNNYMQKLILKKFKKDVIAIEYQKQKLLFKNYPKAKRVKFYHLTF